MDTSGIPLGERKRQISRPQNYLAVKFPRPADDQALLAFLKRIRTTQEV